MSENSFTIPAKKSDPKNTQTENSKEKSTSRKPAASKGSSGEAKKSSAVKATPKAKENPSIESNRVKSSGRMKPGVQPSVPDMGNLTRDERLAKVLGKSSSKKESEKKSSSSRIDPETIKKTISKEKSESNARELPVKVPPVGHRNSRKKGTFNPDVRYILTVLVVFVIILLAAVAIRYRSGRAEDVTEVQAAFSESEAETLEAVLVEIKAGMSARQVASQVEAVTDSAAFLSYLENSGLAGSLQVGTYRVPYGISADELARALTAREDAGKLIIYAGMTLRDIDRTLANRSLSASGDFLAAAERLTSAEGLSFSEGWFLSGSYEFTSVDKLAADMHEALLSTLRENASLVASSPLSVNDIVILASMINRETQDEEQMKTIAGVLFNRLSADEPLGVDATTRYELDRWTGEVSQKEYDRITPYNTRRKKGLPPSGIGSPSAAAIYAVLAPAETTAMYYLHDEEGRLYTSSTYSEHLDTYERVH